MAVGQKVVAHENCDYNQDRKQDFYQFHCPHPLASNVLDQDFLIQVQVTVMAKRNNLPPVQSTSSLLSEINIWNNAFDHQH